MILWPSKSNLQNFQYLDKLIKATTIHCPSWQHWGNWEHYNKRGAYCDPNIIANNKENSFRKPVVPNNNSSHTLKPLRNPQLHTRTIASSSQLPKLKLSQNISDYNVFYTWFVIHNTSKIICNKPNIATT